MVAPTIILALNPDRMGITVASMENDDDILSPASWGSQSPKLQRQNSRIRPTSTQKKTLTLAFRSSGKQQGRSSGGWREDCWNEGATAVLSEERRDGGGRRVSSKDGAERENRKERLVAELDGMEKRKLGGERRRQMRRWRGRGGGRGRIVIFCVGWGRRNREMNLDWFFRFRFRFRFGFLIFKI